MSAYRRDFDETNVFFDKINFQKNIMKFGKKLKTVSKKNLIVNLSIIKYI